MIVKQLLKVVQRRALNQNALKCFGGAAHDDHAPVHAHGPAIDNTQNWVSNKDFVKEQVAIFGFKEAHDHWHPHPDDAFVHLRNKETLSLERFYFADPHYHEDEGEALMNTPHGYITNDDPLDTRNNIERPGLEWMVISMLALCVGLMIGHQGVYLQPEGTVLFNAYVTANMLEDEMRKKRILYKELNDRKESLKEQLGQ